MVDFSLFYPMPQLRFIFNKNNTIGSTTIGMKLYSHSSKKNQQCFRFYLAIQKIYAHFRFFLNIFLFFRDQALMRDTILADYFS